MAMKARSLTEEDEKPPPSWSLAARPHIPLRVEPEPPPLASDGKVVSIWKGRQHTRALTPVEEQLKAMFAEMAKAECGISVPRLADASDGAVVDDSEHYHAALAHITPLGMTSVVKTNGTDLFGNPHRIDRISLDEPFNPLKCGSVCTWVGFTQSENPAAWAEAAVRWRRRTNRSRVKRQRYNKPETTARENLVRIGEYTRPPSVMWFLNHPTGRFDRRFQTPWPPGRQDLGHEHGSITALHKNKEQLWREWYACLSEERRFLIDMPRSHPLLEEDDIRMRDELLLEFQQILRWQFESFKQPALTLPEEDMSLPECVENGYASFMRVLEIVVPEDDIPVAVETEKGNPLVCAEPTPKMADEPYIEGEFEVVSEESQPPSGLQRVDTQTRVSSDQFLVNLAFNGDVQLNLLSPESLEFLSNTHIPRVRAYLDVLVRCKLSGEALQHGSLAASMAANDDVNIDGLMDDANIEMEVERVVEEEPYYSVDNIETGVKLHITESDLLTPTNRGRLYPLNYYGLRPLTSLLKAERKALNPSRYAKFERHAFRTANANRQITMARREREAQALIEMHEERKRQLPIEIEAIKRIGLRQRSMQAVRDSQSRADHEKIAAITKEQLVVELQAHRRVFKDKRSWLTKQRQKLELKLKNLRRAHHRKLWKNPEYAAAFSALRKQPPKLQTSGVVSQKAVTQTNESAQIIVLGDTAVLHKIKKMREWLIVNTTHDLVEILKHESLIYQHYPRLGQADTESEKKPIVAVRPPYLEGTGIIKGNPYTMRAAQRIHQRRAARMAA